MLFIQNCYYILVNNKGLLDVHAAVRASSSHDVSAKIKKEWCEKELSRLNTALKRKSSKHKVKRFMSMIQSFDDYVKVKKLTRKALIYQNEHF